VNNDFPISKSIIVVLTIKCTLNEVPAFLISQCTRQDAVMKQSQ
jgi:hypothetical protein